MLPVVLSFWPVETVFPLYYLAPTWLTAGALLALACAASTIQILYQYWFAGQVEQLAPGFTSKAGDWLRRQPLIKAVLQHTGFTIFALAALPGVRSGGVALWQTTKHRRGGYLLTLGTIVQLTYTLGAMVGLGKLIRDLFH